jgi:hypothetical protein
MAIVMLVGTETAGDPALGTTSARRLSELGITRLAVLRDGGSTAVILEGWTFDPTHGDIAAGVLFPDAADAVRMFREVADVGLREPG